MKLHGQILVACATTVRILVVDDDAAIRTVVAQALRRQGHHVTTAATLAEMEVHLAATLPDVLITDVMLPDGNGLDRLATLTLEHPGLPVIVLSAQNTLTTAVRSTEAGAYDYLPKPFDLDVLARAVSGALARGDGGNGGEPLGEEDRKSAKELGVEPKRITEDALNRLKLFEFPGNVRQLENICHWLTVMAPAQVIETKDLPPELLSGALHEPMPAPP
eukprot:gene32998-44145_t